MYGLKSATPKGQKSTGLLRRRGQMRSSQGITSECWGSFFGVVLVGHCPSVDNYRKYLLLFICFLVSTVYKNLNNH